MCFEEQEQAFVPPVCIPLTRQNISYLMTKDFEIWDTIEQNLNGFGINTYDKVLYNKPEDTAIKWAIGKNLAEATVKAPTQCFIKSAVHHPIDRRFRTRNTYNVKV
jgi:hypothetical protein